MKPDIVHISTVHQRYDTRILAKECSALASSGYRVRFFVADGKGDEERLGVEICDVGKAPSKRLPRFFFSMFAPLRFLMDAGKALVHLHDPELIPLGVFLRVTGKTVVYDMHEDLPEQIMEKAYIPLWARRIIAAGARIILECALPVFSGIVTVTDYLERKNSRLNQKSVAVKNYPIRTSIKPKMDYTGGSVLKILFIGSVYDGRSLSELVRSLYRPELRGRCSLTIIGAAEGDYAERLMEVDEDHCIQIRPFIPYDELYCQLCEYDVGFICDYPYKRNRVGLPIKLFEYMATGLAVIASDFPLWRSIVEPSGAGLLVDPLSEDDIAAALVQLAGEPGLVEAFGRKGREAVERKYSWESEAKTLLAFYGKLKGMSR